MKASRGEIKIHEILENKKAYLVEREDFADLRAPYCDHYIYVHVNKINGKVYVGQTVNPMERWRKYSDSPKFYNALQKYGWENFAHIIVDKVSTEEEANKAEVEWITKLDSMNDEVGYNMTPGGDNYMKTLWQDSNFKARMSDSFRKARLKSWSDPAFIEQAQSKMQEGVQAFWANPEKRAARVENLQGDKNPNHKRVKNLETGRIFSTIKEATEWAGLKAVSCIGANCRGERKSAGKHPVTGEKLHWIYVEEGDEE